ncbi:MAG: hypothetical protein ACFKPT_23130 [Gloeotrichia echinulata GP01]
MNIQLQLKPEIEARLIAQAATQGLSVEAYVESLIEDNLKTKSVRSADKVSTQEQWDAIKQQQRKENIKQLFDSWNDLDEQQEQQETLEIIESMKGISI